MKFARSKDRDAYLWQPQAGPQTRAVTCPVDEIFFGGTRGGGKSDALIGRHIRGAQKWGYAWNGLIVRKKYKEFREMRRRWDELKRNGLPIERIGGDTQINEIRFNDGPYNGASIMMAAIGRLELADDFIGMQFTEVSIDEAPQISYIARLIDKLKGSLRSPHGVPCHLFMTGNPGGPGASAIKVMYIPETDGGEAPVPAGQVNRVQQTLDDGGLYEFSRIFIRSTLYDNQVLMRNDPNYANLLRSIKDPALRAAWLDGLWNVFVGQAFNFTHRNVIDPIWPIPEHVPIYMTFDWGFGAPFSIGWWWVDNDNRVYRCAEWYGWDGVTPNVGQRLTDERIAEGIIEREKKLGIDNRSIKRICDPTCFNKKPNYQGGGQGPSTSEIMEGIGKKHDHELKFYPGDADRKIKIRRFRSRLDPPDDTNKLPMLVVYNTCKHFIRTIPDLCMDELTMEDLEDGQEDHLYDESCHICMDRPEGIQDDEITKIEKAKELHAQREKIKRDSRASMIASVDYQHQLESLRDPDEWTEEGDFVDPEGGVPV
jgi:hypothetical protein